MTHALFASRLLRNIAKTWIKYCLSNRFAEKAAAFISITALTAHEHLIPVIAEFAAILTIALATPDFPERLPIEIAEDTTVLGVERADADFAIPMYAGVVPELFAGITASPDSLFVSIRLEALVMFLLR